MMTQTPGLLAAVGQKALFSLSRHTAYLTVLPDLWVSLAAALDLMHQSAKCLQRAGVDEGQASP